MATFDVLPRFQGDFDKLIPDQRAVFTPPVEAHVVRGRQPCSSARLPANSISQVDDPQRSGFVCASRSLEQSAFDAFIGRVQSPVHPTVHADACLNRPVTRS